MKQKSLPEPVAFEDRGERADLLRGVSRVVLKVGTRLLADVAGVSKRERVEQLVAQIAWLRERGIETVLVTSGAIGAGMSVLDMKRRPPSLPDLQALAAVGQSRLMYLYEAACVRHGFHCGQLLLTAADLKNRERHLNAAQCLHALLAKEVLPVINENDSVSVDEIRFGDNDILAALVAVLLRADLTVLLTTVDGLHLPQKDGAGWGPRVSVVRGRIPRSIRAAAGGTDGNPFSTGGMASKIRAAEIVTKAGEALWVADALDFGRVRAVFEGEDVGTLFLPPLDGGRMQGRKRFLAFFSEPRGTIYVDDGAARALCEQGRSLLPSGIVRVEGAFRRGDTVRICSDDGREVARGVSNYPAEIIARIKGLHTSEVRRRLGIEAYDEVVHRNHLVITADQPETPND